MLEGQEMLQNQELQGHPANKGAQNPIDAVTLDLQCVGADAQEGIKSFFEKRAPDFPLKPSKDMPPFGPWAK